MRIEDWSSLFMKMLWRMGLVALAVVLVYWFTVPVDSSKLACGRMGDSSRGPGLA